MNASLKTVLYSVALLASATTLWAFAARAFDSQVGNCPWRGTLVLSSLRADLPITGVLQNVGDASFRDTKVNREDDKPAYVQRFFEGVEGKAESPEVGTITWSVERDRQAAAEAAGLVTTVQALQADADLPARADIWFYAEVRISSQPDRVYKSVNPVHFSSDNVNTYPFKEEEFRIAEPVEFADESGQAAFRIESDGSSAFISTEG